MSSRAVSCKTIRIFKIHLKWGQRAKNSSKLCFVMPSVMRQAMTAGIQIEWRVSATLWPLQVIKTSHQLWFERALHPNIQSHSAADRHQPSGHRKHGRFILFHLKWIEVQRAFQNPSICMCLSQAGRYGCLFSCYAVEWQRVGLISCCWRLRPVKGSKEKRKKRQGWAFLRADMAAVHFSPDLLSEKPVTSLLINAPARRTVSKLRQTLNPDNLRDSARPSLRPPTSARRPAR